jgi:FixJ family two-component response regulator
MSGERRGAHVAVIEDDDLERGALGRLLQADGFEPDLFASAETFIASRQNQTWICLVIDVHLTGMSGLDLQRKLREEGSAVPIIMTTGSKADAIRERAQQSGCVAFLWKPVNADTILAIVESIAVGCFPDPKGTCTYVQ